MSPSGFLVVGEALVDVVHRGRSVERLPGGGPANVAVGLARLGHAVTDLCYLGDDGDGDLVREHLHIAGIRLQAGALTAAATSRADVSIDESGDASYRFSVHWDVPTSLDWTGFDVVHTGSIALALDPGASHLLELLRTRPPGVRLVVDPNIRPAFFDAAMAERVEPFLALADLVKLSDDDAGHLYPGLSHDLVIDRILALGPGLVALTLGEEGSILATAHDRVRVPSAAAGTVVDTIGAGDSYMAALVSAVAETNDWIPDAGRLSAFGAWSARAAGITVSRAGANPPMREELA